MSIQNWKKIQKIVGATPDGVPGPNTAKAILAKLGADPVPNPKVGSLVTGRGDRINRIFIHCSATRAGQDIDAATVKRWHLGRGWSDIGYHFFIKLDGTIERGRSEAKDGAHVSGFNDRSIAVCYAGGVGANGKGRDTRTPAQKKALKTLVAELRAAYPKAKVMGHRDASPDLDGDGVVERHEWIKECPSFDVKAEFG